MDRLYFLSKYAVEMPFIDSVHEIDKALDDTDELVVKAAKSNPNYKRHFE